MAERLILSCDMFLLIGVTINAFIVNFTDKKLLNKVSEKKANYIRIISILIVVCVFVLFILGKIIY